MNLLLDRLPTEYEGLKIKTNFRSFILFELLMQERKISIEDKIPIALSYFFDEPPQDIEKAIKGILWFYCKGDVDKKPVKAKEKSNQNKIYSYEYDGDYIYSAFLSQYGIDLNDIEYLHWWKFKSLFECLNDENKICQIMGYRAIDLNKIKDDKERAKYRNLKQTWALPDERTEEEKENDFAEAFW